MPSNPCINRPPNRHLCWSMWWPDNRATVTLLKWPSHRHGIDHLPKMYGFELWSELTLFHWTVPFRWPNIALPASIVMRSGWWSNWNNSTDGSMHSTQADNLPWPINWYTYSLIDANTQNAKSKWNWRRDSFLVSVYFKNLLVVSLLVTQTAINRCYKRNFHIKLEKNVLKIFHNRTKRK